jgi:broad specificity phosphatase PhoE
LKVLIRIELPIDVPKEREEIYSRLKRALETAEAIANNRKLKGKTRIEALRLVGYICQIMLGAVKDVQVEDIERKLEELEKEAGED